MAREYIWTPILPEYTHLPNFMSISPIIRELGQMFVAPPLLLSYQYMRTHLTKKEFWPQVHIWYVYRWSIWQYSVKVSMTWIVAHMGKHAPQESSFLGVLYSSYNLAACHFYVYNFISMLMIAVCKHVYKDHMCEIWLFPDS